ncbi:hypothetical protein HO133_006619 [Letharia lupina]|uniref:Uncharacterized protein n=1 Tax=Letharia lupina TaxID=560253 RepID=A0A8H6F710_9LECA|nr:uncharacterized protein HO133_006619 [Letharia lupina]KAF6217792.1 hypothetical protein HO133_006619 [Letharia lupina]
MDPWKSWAIVGVFGLGAAYYYSQSGKNKRGRGRAPPLLSAEQSQRRGSDQRNDSKDKRKKKGKLSDTSDQPGSDAGEVASASVQTSTNGTVKKRKGGKKQPSKLAQSSAAEIGPEQGLGTENGIAEDEEMDNEEFARQLSGLKTGTSLKKPATQNENKKTRKQGKRNEAPPQAMNGSALKTNGVASSQDMSTASSTTGADADDDLSPAMSPDLRATQATTTSSTDISDMLEPAPKGSSILRITEPANPQPVRQPKAQKGAPEPETKKQRQNRQKNEDKKAMRERAEKERRALLEKQLRTAREAEGRPAKNGLAPSQLPSTNAWNKPASAATDSSGPVSKQSSVSLLDTFEDAPTTAPNPRSTNGGANGVSNGVSVDGKVWNNDLPSEEEQMRMITEMDSDNAWSTVAKGGKSKKKSSAAVPANKDSIHSSGNQKKDTSSTTAAASLAISADNKKTPKANNNNNNSTSSTMPPISAEHDNTTSSGAEKKDIPTGVMASKEENLNKTATSPTKDSKNEESASNKATDAHEPKHVKATYETIDHSVWTRKNITEHPDYDPDFPYALTGHPDDDEWAVC